MASEARVEGLRYDLPPGYPAIIVPEKTIPAVGTRDGLRDVRAMHTLDRGIAGENKTTAVHGELCVFGGLEERLPAIDASEGSVLKNPFSPYRRLLLPDSLRAWGVTTART